MIRLSGEEIAAPRAIALGNFDGIHRGHQQVLRAILDHPGGIHPTVVSFTPHPREFFSGEKRRLLTPLAEKAEILGAMGLEQLVLLPFDASLVALTPERFVEEILVKKLGAKSVSVGEDFRFGRQRSGDAGDLKTIGGRYGVEVKINPLRKDDGKTRISSSLIRRALAEGDLSHAASMLGRPYTLIGKVVSGRRLGREIGFPTANLELPADKLLPRSGVYSVWVEYEWERMTGVMNIGHRPTVSGDGITVEVHLLDRRVELYDRVLRVSPREFLRPERKFSSLDELKTQIALDCERARKSLLAPG